MTRNPVSLPLAVARCPSTRTEPCSVAGECARALAAAAGRMSQDFSIEARGPGGACMHHLPADKFRSAPAAPGPKVHEAVRGIA